MLHRFPALLIVLMTIPGLLGRQACYVVHEHDGGAEPHQHHAHFTEHIGRVHHSHPHGHSHEHLHEGDESPADDPSDESVPGDDERHGHYQAGEIVAVRRATLLDDSRMLLARCAPEPVELVYEAPVAEARGRPPSPGDSRGHPTSRTERMVDRLVQGIGLLI